ncbi:hypothetical protein YTPLAS73_12340 [Nitrosarchaeum sp.]|nr:hypothetical protein YTPLAS73_12340 [Nitrosarchaeum sp.]
MSSLGGQAKKSKDNSIFIIGGVIAAGALLLFAYLMWYVAPTESMELVRIVAVTESGCVAETSDGFAVNIGDCKGEPDQYVMASVDKKIRERAAMMNPTS